MEFFNCKKKLEEKDQLKDNFMSIKNIKELENIVNSQLANKINKSTIENNELMIEINLENLEDVIQYLKSDDTCKFRQLIDIVGIDFPQEEKRFKLIYLLLSHENNSRIKISINFEPEKKVPSITKIFPSANWMEREVFDMYGVNFKDHPDLRRILTDYGFEGHPLRKDFPLTGHSEVRYSEDKKKVISEPVKLEQNYRNFDYESPWEGTKYIKDQSENNGKKN